MKPKWIKWYPVQWLHSTARDELTTEQRATFHDFVCLAAISPTPGKFKFTHTKSLARQLNTSVEIIEETIRVCSEKKRIEVYSNEEGYLCKICKWNIYQPIKDNVNNESEKKEKKLTLNNTDKIREDKRREEKKSSRKFSNAHLETAKLLEKKIKERMPRYKIRGKQYLKDWANEFRLMEERDSIMLDDIRKLIFWIFDKSDFWYKNILSADKLREKFGRLWEEMKPAKTQEDINIKYKGRQNE